MNNITDTQYFSCNYYKFLCYTIGRYETVKGRSIMKKVTVFLLVAVLIGGGVSFYFWQHNQSIAADREMAALTPTPATTVAPGVLVNPQTVEAGA